MTPIIHVRALFFALYRDFAGVGEMELALPAGATALAAVERVRASSPALARLPEQPVVAVNREYAPLDTEMHDGDEIAFLPPVAGG